MLTYQCCPNHLDNSHHKLLVPSSTPLSDPPSLVSLQLRVAHLKEERKRQSWKTCKSTSSLFEAVGKWEEQCLLAVDIRSGGKDWRTEARDWAVRAKYVKGRKGKEDTLRKGSEEVSAARPTRSDGSWRSENEGRKQEQVSEIGLANCEEPFDSSSQLPVVSFPHSSCIQ